MYKQFIILKHLMLNTQYNFNLTFNFRSIFLRNMTMALEGYLDNFKNMKVLITDEAINFLQKRDLQKT